MKRCTAGGGGGQAKKMERGTAPRLGCKHCCGMQGGCTSCSLACIDPQSDVQPWASLHAASGGKGGLVGRLQTGSRAAGALGRTRAGLAEQVRATGESPGAGVVGGVVGVALPQPAQRRLPQASARDAAWAALAGVSVLARGTLRGGTVVVAGDIAQYVSSRAAVQTGVRVCGKVCVFAWEGGEGGCTDKKSRPACARAWTGQAQCTAPLRLAHLVHLGCTTT